MHYVFRQVAICWVVLTCMWGAIPTTAASAGEADSATSGTPAAQVESDQSESPATPGEAAPSPAAPVTAARLEKYVIGAIAFVVESQSKLQFQARVDTGAASCSIHCEQWEIQDEAESMDDNIGKPIRILLGNHNDEPEWIETRIDRCVTVKTSERKERRYKVPLTLRWQNVEKQVVVTLNNRKHMSYPLLLGRNFLEGDFVVDIDHKHDRGKELAQVP